MSQPALVIDGAQQHGSRVITFSNGCVGIMENFNIATSATEASDRKISGAPNRARWTRDRYTGSGVLQLPYAIAATSKPKFGDYFTVTASSFDANYDDIMFVVNKPPEFESSNEASEIRKGPVTFSELVNGVPTIVAAS